MSFNRSYFGEKNRPIFLDYDVLIILEANSNTPIERSWEARYWKALAAKCLPNAKFRIFQASNKAGAIKKATFLESIQDVKYLCCIDRDIDDALGIKYEGINVVQTFRYSFEADLIYIESLADVYEVVIGGLIDKATIVADFERCMTEMIRDCKVGILADFVGLQKGFGFFCRKTETSFMKAFRGNDHGQIPYMCRKSAKERISEMRTKVTESSAFFKANLVERCYGKVLAWLGYRCVTYKLNVESNIKLSREHFHKVLADKVIIDVENDRFPFLAHYRSQFVACQTRM